MLPIHRCRCGRSFNSLKSLNLHRRHAKTHDRACCRYGVTEYVPELHDINISAASHDDVDDDSIIGDVENFQERRFSTNYGNVYGINDAYYELQNNHYDHIYGLEALQSENLQDFIDTCRNLSIDDHMLYRIYDFSLRNNLSREASNELLHLFRFKNSDDNLPIHFRSITRKMEKEFSHLVFNQKRCRFLVHGTWNYVKINPYCQLS